MIAYVDPTAAAAALLSMASKPEPGDEPKMSVELGFGVDGILFVLPPAEVRGVAPNMSMWRAGLACSCRSCARVTTSMPSKPPA